MKLLLKTFINAFLILSLVVTQTEVIAFAGEAAVSDLTITTSNTLLNVNKSILTRLSTFPLAQSLNNSIANSKISVDDFIKALPESSKSFVKFQGPLLGSKIVQSVLLIMVTKAALLVVSKLADQRLKYTTENVHDMSTKVVKELSPGALVDPTSWAYSFGASILVSALRDLMPNAVLSEIISATVYALLTGGLGDFVTVTIARVLAHPAEVGGLSDGERRSLESLLHKPGIFNLSAGLNVGTADVKSAYTKVFTAMTAYFCYSDDLRSSMMSHIRRELLLSGNVVTVIEMIIITSFVTKKVIGVSTWKTKGWLKYTGQSAGIGAINFVGTAGMLDMIQDGQTFAMRIAASYAEKKLQDSKDENLKSTLSNIMAPGSVLSPAIEVNLNERVRARETRLDLQLSLVRISLDKLNFYIHEVESLEHDAKKLEELQKTEVPKIDQSGTDQMAPWSAPESREHFSAWYQYAKTAVPFYENMFEKSAQNVVKIYESESRQFAMLAQLTKQPAQKLKLLEFASRTKAIQAYLQELVNSLRLGAYVGNSAFDSSSFDSKYVSSRKILDVSSFWQLRESDIQASLTR